MRSWSYKLMDGCIELADERAGRSRFEQNFWLHGMAQQTPLARRVTRDEMGKYHVWVDVSITSVGDLVEMRWIQAEAGEVRLSLPTWGVVTLARPTQWTIHLFTAHGRAVEFRREVQSKARALPDGRIEDNPMTLDSTDVL